MNARIADTKLNQDGELVRIITFNGRSFLVPIKDMKLIAFDKNDRAAVRCIDDKGD